MGAIKNIKVPIEVVLGTAEARVEDLEHLSLGSIVELTSFAGEPVILRAAGKEIARGEVVVIDENFGLRITGITGEER